MDKKPKRKTRAPAPRKPITDPRFASFDTDPRFRLPSKRHGKTTIDKRFSRLLTDEEFTASARVDRYGRRIKSDSRKKALQRLYQEEGGEEEEEEEEEEDKIESRDPDRKAEAEHPAETYDPARQGGFSSSSDSDSDSDSGEEQETLRDAEGQQSVGPGGRRQDEVELGEVTRRIAVVNMDWDFVKSADVMALFSSFLPEGPGRVEKVSVYPSEFGKERMKREEVEGPPKEIFGGSEGGSKAGGGGDEGEGENDLDSEAEEERIKNELIKEGDDQDFDHDALRAYQLDRLRYYYAVVMCSDAATAQSLYGTIDGTEFQSSSNFLDLRFVPDDVTFDDEPRDECTRVPEGYKPLEFVTSALQSSKVKLTWDLHPEDAERKESIRKAFSGSRADIQESDLKAYLASDSDDDDNDDDDDDDDDDDGGAVVVEVVGGDGAQIEKTDDELPKLAKKQLARRKLREALGLGDEPMAKVSRDGPVGDMQVTFAAALTGREQEAHRPPEEAETTIEKYKRKERERRERKRQARGEAAGEEREELVEPPADDRGFDDPFFTTADEPAAAAAAARTKSTVRKEERRKRREAREAAEAENSEQRAVLQRVVAEHEQEVAGAGHLDHFDMNAVRRGEKRKGKKDKKKGRPKQEGDDADKDTQPGFKMDTNDERFRAVFEDHAFAIDPSNPRFKPTEGMRQLLEEGRKKRKHRDDTDPEAAGERKAKKSKDSRAREDLVGLVASVKRKAKK